MRQRNNIEKKIILGGKRKTTKRQKHEQATALLETGPILEAFLTHICATKVTHLVSRKFGISTCQTKKIKSCLRPYRSTPLPAATHTKLKFSSGCHDRANKACSSQQKVDKNNMVSYDELASKASLSP